MQPIDYSSAGLQALQGGLTAGANLREAGIRQQAADRLQAQDEREQRALEAQQTYFGNLSTALQSGNSDDVLSLMAANPQYMESTQKLMGIKNAAHRDAVGGLSQQVGALLDSGNTEGAAELIRRNPKLFASFGQDAGVEAQTLLQDPAAYRQQVGQMAMLSMTPEKVQEFKDKQEDLRLRQYGHDTTRRGQDITATTAANRLAFDKEKYTTPYPTVGGEGSGAITLSSGDQVMPIGKPVGQGKNAVQLVELPDGSRQYMPLAAMTPARDTPTAAPDMQTREDLALLRRATPQEVGGFLGFVGPTGGTESGTIGAEYSTRLSANPDTRRMYLAAKRINAQMANMGIAAATAMGASGINTEGEAKRFGESMPRIDTTSFEAYQNSLNDIARYVEAKNQEKAAEKNPTYSGDRGGNQQAPAQLSDEELINKYLR